MVKKQELNFTPANFSPENPEDFLPKKKETPQPSGSSGGGRAPTENTIDVFQDVRTGRPSGFVDPRTGKTFLGAPANRIREIINTLNVKRQGTGREPFNVSNINEQSKQVLATQEAQASNEALGLNQEEVNKTNLGVGESVGQNFGTIGNFVEIQGIIAGAQTLRQEQIDKILNDAEALPLEMQKDFILQEVDKQLFLEDLRVSDRLGIIIEGIPLIGGKIASWVRGLSTPSEKVNDLISVLDRQAGRVTKAGERSNRNPDLAAATLNDVEKQINDLEKRIQNLIIISPILRGEPEEVERIETKIQEIREDLRNKREIAALNRLNIAAGITQPNLIQ